MQHIRKLDYFFLLCIAALVLHKGDSRIHCPRLKYPGRICGEPCDESGRCSSRRYSCRCDGVCGLVCVANDLRCPRLLYRFQNGRLTIRPNNKFGGEATYRCDDGYELRGTRTRICQGDGEWSQLQPYCERMEVPNGLTRMSSILEDDCPRVVNKNSRRKCKKRCDANGSCASPRNECVCDGDCGRSCINKNLKCDSLGKAIPNGKINISPYNKFAAIASYECEDGFKLNGISKRVCQGNGKWSDTAPSCELDRESSNNRTGCREPPAIFNAVHDAETGVDIYDLGVMVQYSCLPGFETQKDSIVRAWCVGGGMWVGPKMVCSHAGCPVNTTHIQNGRIIAPEQMSTGAKLRYQCDDGYFLAGRDERTCQVNGEWDGLEPSCEKVTCGPPPNIEHAIILEIKHGGSFSSGQQIRYECETGYELQGDSRAMCNDGGEWVGLTDLRCEAVNCGYPSVIENGWRQGFQFSYGETVVYHCDEGYELVGVSRLTCREDQKWSNVPPECIAVECEMQRAPLHGTMVGSGNAYGTVLIFKCAKGFNLTGTAERRCLSNGTWDGTPPSCEEIDCKWPTPFWNGYIIGDQTKVGSEIFFSCNLRTNFLGPALKATCLENGRWSDPPPTCWGQCRVPSIPDANLTEYQPEEWLRHGTVIEYHCRYGLVPEGGSRVTCQNGTWTSIPRCVPSPCPYSPPHVDNGLRIFDGLRHGSRARYFCRNGYKLTGLSPQGSDILECKYGKWVAGRPSCEEYYCPNPGTLDHGKVYKKGLKGRFEYMHYIKTIRHGDRLEFTCNSGYERLGPSGATCVNGHWRPDLRNPGTRCVISKHAPFNKLWIPLEEQ